MAVPHIQPDYENTAYEAYRRHRAGCLECALGRGFLCPYGRVLHTRWAAAQEEQQETDG